MTGLLSIYDVACPYCRAVRGDLCREHPSKRERRYPHALRVDAFRAALKPNTGGSE